MTNGKNLNMTTRTVKQFQLHCTHCTPYTQRKYSETKILNGCVPAKFFFYLILQIIIYLFINFFNKLYNKEEIN